MDDIRYYMIWALAGYLSGSILYAYWIPKMFFHADIRKLGEDGNPGTYNVFAHCGVAAGITVLILELGKGFIPVFLAGKFLSTGRWPFALVLASPVAGHAFPLWRNGSGDRFRGGKGIAVSFGSLLGLFPALMPVLLLACSYLFYSLVIVIQPHRFRSILTFITWETGCCFMLGKTAVSLGCIMICLIVVFKHLDPVWVRDITGLR